LDGESQKAGFFVSGAMHLALLAVLVIGVSRAPKFDDAPESIPVETVTTTQLNEIMQGEKTGKAAPPPPKAEPQPQKTEPPPPEPPKRPDPPPEPAKAPPPPAPEPPKRPPPPPPKPEAEDAPSPPVRPRPPKPEEETPRPPERQRVAKAEEPKPDKFKPDDIAKALAKEKAEEKPKPKPPAFDPNAINKLIGQQTRSAEIKPSAAAPLGLQNRNSPHMSVSLENALNEWFRDSYKNCWNLPPSNPVGENYVFDVRVTFNPDGSLATRPVMLNPPHDPEWRAHADSVMRAVQRCNPLHIPTQYAPFFDQWRSKTIHFDPASAEG
jgi:colicin import membrane protein